MTRSRSPAPRAVRGLRRVVDGPHRRGMLVVAGYRAMATLVSVVHLVMGHASYSWTSPRVIVTAIAFYSAAAIALHLRWGHMGRVGSAVLGCDVALSLSLLLSSGGLFSPFLLYGLVPVLSSSLFLAGKTTSVLALMSVASVALGYFASPTRIAPLGSGVASYFFAYVAAVSLTGLLPHIFNYNALQKVVYEDTLRERQRLSREIHDGLVQTLSALRWQAQVLHRRLAKTGIDIAEVKQIESLAERAWFESREFLDVVREYTGDGSLIPHVQSHLEHLRRECKIEYTLDLATDLRLGRTTELELLLICQEAINNIRVHSGATSVRIVAAAVNGCVAVTIADNGRGFDSMAFYRNGIKSRGHGLNVMHERAQSVGGKCLVLSVPGRGTEVRVEMPSGHRWLHGTT